MKRARDRRGAHSSDLEVRLLAALDPDLSAADQELLSRDRSARVRRTLAQHPALTRDVQHALASDEVQEVRAQLARITSIPEVQEQLSRDTTMVCYHLADNTSLAPEVQERLSRDESVVVRRDLACNEELTSQVYVTLSLDDDREVLWNLAANTSVVLSTSMGVRFMQEFPSGRTFRDEHLAEIDATTRNALAPTWHGSLDELVLTCQALAPESASFAEAARSRELV